MLTCFIQNSFQYLPFITISRNFHAVFLSLGQQLLLDEAVTEVEKDELRRRKRFSADDFDRCQKALFYIALSHPLFNTGGNMQLWQRRSISLKLWCLLEANSFIFCDFEKSFLFSFFYDRLNTALERTLRSMSIPTLFIEFTLDASMISLINNDLVYHIYPTPPLGQVMTQGQFLSVV